MLEAVIIASIMVSAVAFVTTFETPQAAPVMGRANLEQVAGDALSILYDTPVTGSSFGENALSVYLAQCMQGDCDNLTEKIDALVPAGSKYAVYVSNGYETFPVYLENLPDGEAVTATQLLEPKWSNTFASSGVTNVNPASDALLTYALPIFNSNVVTPGGSPLKVLVEGIRGSDGANYTVTGFYTTVALDASKAGQSPAVSLHFLETAANDSAPAALRDVRDLTLTPDTALPTKAPVPFTIQLRETAGVAIPAGAELTVNLPRGWTGAADPGWNAEKWLVLADATDPSGSREGSSITARLLAPVESHSVNFTFDAVYHGDVLSNYPFQAVLSKGAASEANLLVRADNANSADQPFAVPGVYMSVPRPMGALATTNWTLVVEIPYRASEDVTLEKDKHNEVQLSITTGEHDASVTRVKSSVRIDRIRIVEEDGAAIFKEAPEVISTTTPGTWTSTGSGLLWEGSHDASTGPLAMTFKITASGTGGKPETRPGLVPPVTFDTWDGRILTQVAPGFFRGSFLPESADYSGYNVTNATGSGILHTFRSDTLYRSTLLPGSSNYTINPAAAFQDSVHGSYAAVDQRAVPVGGTAVVTADVQSLLFALSKAGQEAGVKVRFYPPWSGDDRTPIWEEGNLDQGLLTGDVTQLTLLDLNGDSYLDPVVGTDNGRVFGFNGLNGARIQGNAFLAPIRAGSTVTTAPAITHLSTITIDGTDYIVVGTDKQSGIFVLDKGMNVKWSWMKPNVDTVALDTSVSLNGDSRKDIIVALSNYAIYVLTVPSADAEDPVTLVPYQAPGTEPTVPDAFYVNVGEATALIGLPSIGPDNQMPGFAVTFQSVPGVAGVREEDPVGSVTNAKPVTSLPRAGLRGIDAAGKERWTFFGSPVELARAYDYDGDALLDIVGGSPAGYVYMMNGKGPTQPLYSTVLIGVPKAVDGEAADAANAAFVTDDGLIVFTNDGWNEVQYGWDQLPAVNGIAINGTNSMWLAGNGSRLWRGVTEPVDPSSEWLPYVYFPEVYPINASRSNTLEVGGLGAVPLDVDYFTTHVHNFYDVTFRWGDSGGQGWVVGDMCPLECTESIVMRTVDGGHTWTLATSADGTLLDRNGAAVTAALHRINFTTAQVGWIVGDQGTLLRSVDSGIHWKGVEVPTPAKINDISCAPEDPAFCILVANDGKAYKSTNALDGTPLGAASPATPAWTEITTLGAGASDRALLSVGLMSSDIAYIGAANMVLRSGNGGADWTTLPMNYLENDGVRISAFPDGSGYVFGGSAVNTRTFFLADYELSSRAQTVSLTAGLPQTARVTGVALDAIYLPYEDPNSVRDSVATFSASPGCAGTWTKMQEKGTPALETGMSAGNMYAYFRSAYEATFDPAGSGRDLCLRVDLTVSGQSSLYTPRVRDMTARISYVDGASTGELVVPIDLSTTSQRDASATTAAWDTKGLELRAPVMNEYWTRNVSGEVRDVQTGYDVAGDPAYDEVWVATGGVLAGNSPDHIIYAGSDEGKYVHSDNRIYLLDGKTGNILEQTSSFRGNVTHLRLSQDNDADGRPDFLYATIWEPASATGSGPNGYLAALDPVTLTVFWMTDLGHVQPADVEAVTGEGGASFAVAAMQSVESSTGQVEPGKVWALRSDAKVLWSVLPHEQGYYLVIKQIPRNWFFGAYIVEVEVSWTEEVSETIDGVSATRSVFQAARFYDYFLVTPPDALSPPSPVYNVHLVAWYPDWT